MANRILKTWFFLFVAILSAAGCGNKRGHERNPTEDRLYKIGKAYLQTCFRLGRAPESFDEIKPDIRGDIPEDLLISPNDGEKFVILWGVDVTELSPTKEDQLTVTGYEKNGVDGTRYVLRFPISIAKMTDEELQKAGFPPGFKAPK
jgi:hypothetical protein